MAVGVAMMATPVSGHIGTSVTHLWNAHLKAKTDVRYYTKAQANGRYLGWRARRRTPSSWTGSTWLRSCGRMAAAGGGPHRHVPNPAIADGAVTISKLAPEVGLGFFTGRVNDLIVSSDSAGAPSGISQAAAVGAVPLGGRCSS